MTVNGFVFDNFDAADGTLLSGRTTPTGQIWYLGGEGNTFPWINANGKYLGYQDARISNGEFISTSNVYPYLDYGRPISKISGTFSMVLGDGSNNPSRNMLTLIADNTFDTESGPDHGLGTMLHLIISPTGCTLQKRVAAKGGSFDAIGGCTYDQLTPGATYEVSMVISNGSVTINPPQGKPVTILDPDIGTTIIPKWGCWQIIPNNDAWIGRWDSVSIGNPDDPDIVYPHPRPLATEKDFGGDGKSDILWRNVDGTNAIWQVDGNQIYGNLLPSLNSDWAVAGIGDFSGDGKSDILWRNVDGTNAIWQVDGNQIYGNLLPSLNSDWAVAGIGDFSGDGKSDILWRNVDGTNAIWQVDGNQIYGNLLPSLNSDWAVAGIGDFSGDGKSDILWRNVDGTNAIWQVDGNQIYGNLLPSLNSDWAVAGIGDFSGDGKSDILWRNVDGTNAIWQVDGNQIYGNLLPSLNSDWAVAGIGDFSGDGKSDILWRNVDGTNAIWQVDGNQIGGNLIPSLNSAWAVQGF